MEIIWRPSLAFLLLLGLAWNRGAAQTNYPRLIPSTTLTNGQFHLLLQQRPYLTYYVQASTDLIRWSTVGTNFSTNTLSGFVDTAAPQLEHRFYRALAPTNAFDKWTLWSGPTLLRGANVHQRRVYPELDGPEFLGPGPIGPPYTQNDFDKLAALGANYVNISHPGFFSEDPPYVLDLAVKTNLDNLLGMISNANMFAVISFRTGPGRSEFSLYQNNPLVTNYIKQSVWTNQLAQDGWVAMWRYTASQYRDSSVVVGYDLMVEPNSNETSADPPVSEPEGFYPAYAQRLQDWNPLAARITAAVRGVDTSTPLLISSMDYGAVKWLPYVRTNGDARTVYTVHPYEPFSYTHQALPANLTYPGVIGTNVFNRAYLDRLLDEVDSFKAANHVPVAANEFGPRRYQPGANLFVADQMDWLEQRKLNHAIWLWGASWPPAAGGYDDFNVRQGPDPSNHSDVTTSSLLNALTNAWSRNLLRPSTVRTGN